MLTCVTTLEVLCVRLMELWLPSLGSTFPDVGFGSGHPLRFELCLDTPKVFKVCSEYEFELSGRSSGDCSWFRSTSDRHET